MPSSKKRQTRFASHKRPIVIGLALVVVLAIAYVIYGAVGNWQVTRYQADTESAMRYRDTVYVASDRLRRPTVVDYLSGRQSIPAVRLAFSATPNLDLTYNVFDDVSGSSGMVALSSNQTIDQAKTMTGSITGKTYPEMLANVSASIAQVQACRRQVTIMLGARGQTPAAPEGGKNVREAQLTLRDGRTAVIYRDTDCAVDSAELLSAAKAVTSL